MVYFGTRLSENISKREPEGYLICLNVPVARTGTQEYLPSELGLQGMDDRMIPVERTAEEVFDPACVASFQGMPVTDDHPKTTDGVTAENIRFLQKGHAMNIRRGPPPEDDLLMADLIITDPKLIEEILGGKREISCGYNYVLSEEDGKYYQREIRGNHVAVVDAGRAGPRVCIKDSAKCAGSPLPATDGSLLPALKRGQLHVGSVTRTESADTSPKRGRLQMGSVTQIKDLDASSGERSSFMNRKNKAFAKLMARMAKDEDTEALEEAIAEIMGEEPETAADPTDADPVAPVVVETPVEQPVIIDCGPEILEALQRIISLLGGNAADCGNPERQEDTDPEEVEASVGVSAAEAAEAVAETVEATAEAVAQTVAEAMGMEPAGEDPLTDDDPIEELIQEILEGTAEPEEAVSEEILSTILEPEDETDYGSLLPALKRGQLHMGSVPQIEDLDASSEDPEEKNNEQAADTLRAALTVFKPQIMKMSAKDRVALHAQVAEKMKGLTRKNRDRNSYDAVINMTARDHGGRALGEKIMKERNANRKA